MQQLYREYHFTWLKSRSTVRSAIALIILFLEANRIWFGLALPLKERASYDTCLALWMLPPDLSCINFLIEVYMRLIYLCGNTKIVSSFTFSLRVRSRLYLCHPWQYFCPASFLSLGSILMASHLIFLCFQLLLLRERRWDVPIAARALCSL